RGMSVDLLGAGSFMDDESTRGYTAGHLTKPPQLFRPRIRHLIPCRPFHETRADPVRSRPTKAAGPDRTWKMSAGLMPGTVRGLLRKGDRLELALAVGGSELGHLDELIDRQV